MNIWTAIFLFASNWVCSYDPPDEIVAVMVRCAPDDVYILFQDRERMERVIGLLERPAAKSRVEFFQRK